MSIVSINPATEETLEVFEPFSPEQIDQALESTYKTFQVWKNTSFAERSAALHKVAGILRDQQAELAAVATQEMGKPLTEAKGEVEKCAWNCDYYADHAEEFLADEQVKSNASASYIAYDPLGVVLAVMPWNFPYWQVFRFAAPALMAGNTVVLKHASNVSRVALEIERVFQRAGMPEGIFRTLLVSGSQLEPIIADPRIAAVTLTGSEAAGIAVASASGHALKKTVLELGGSDPFIILEDADLNAAVQLAIRSRFQNTGQSCIAAKRFIVVEEVADRFAEAFVQAVSVLPVGDPLKEDTKIGPLARGDLRSSLDQQVKQSVEMGGKILLGGEIYPGKGYYYAPTIVADVTPAMPVFHEETFGPVAAVIRARNADHAIELANTSQFGLGSNLWTRNIDQARHLARKIEAGAVFINGMTVSDPRLPFGGIKSSGYGRELSMFGIREFVNIKTIWIGPAAV